MPPRYRLWRGCMGQSFRLLRRRSHQFLQEPSISLACCPPRFPYGRSASGQCRFHRLLPYCHMDGSLWRSRSPSALCNRWPSMYHYTPPTELCGAYVMADALNGETHSMNINSIHCVCHPPSENPQPCEFWEVSPPPWRQITGISCFSRINAASPPTKVIAGLQCRTYLIFSVCRAVIMFRNKAHDRWMSCHLRAECSSNFIAHIHHCPPPDHSEQSAFHPSEPHNIMRVECHDYQSKA